MATPTEPGANLEIVSRAFATLNRRDPDALAEFWDEDIVEDFVPVGVFRGRKAVRDYFAAVFAAMPDLRIDTDRMAVDGETVFVSWRLSGTHTGGEFEGIAATGRRIDMRGVDCFTVRDGRIVHNVVFYDGASFLRQSGMLPARGSAAERTTAQAFNAVTALRGRLRRS